MRENGHKQSFGKQGRATAGSLLTSGREGTPNKRGNEKDNKRVPKEGEEFRFPD